MHSLYLWYRISIQERLESQPEGPPFGPKWVRAPNGNRSRANDWDFFFSENLGFSKGAMSQLTALVGEASRAAPWLSAGKVPGSPESKRVLVSMRNQKPMQASETLRRLNQIQRAAGLGNKSRNSFPWKRTIVAGCFVIGVAILGYWGTDGWAYVQSRRLAADLQLQTGDGLNRVVGRLSLLDRYGVAVLVEGLQSRQPEVRKACQHKLADLVDSWRMQTSSESSANIGHLARCLARQIDLLPPGERRFAANLATELLLWPLDQRQVDTTQVVMHCELILRSGRRVEGLGSEWLAREEASQPSDASDSEEKLSVRERELADVRWTDPVIAGGGIPVQPLPIPATPPDTQEYELEAPNRFIPNRSGKGLPARIEDAIARNEVKPSRPVQDPSVLPPELSEPQQPEILWGRLSHIEVLKRLHLSEYESRNQAYSELQRRGFTPELVNIGRQATSPRDVDRLDLAISLRKRKDVDPLPWLRYLSEDVHLEVSQQALLALSEMADPLEARLARERLKTENRIATESEPETIRR
jgi:hypothetical protein